MIHNFNKSLKDLAPTLKRPLSDICPLKNKLLEKSTTDLFSRQFDEQVRPRFQVSKTQFDAKTLPKNFDESTLTQFSTNNEEMPAKKEEAILKVQQKIAEIIGQDIRHSTKIKDKKSYHHRYEQKQNNSHIVVSQPKWIPRQVLEAHQGAEAQLERGQRVNFLQGFLSQIGFMFYAVERKVYFYDLEVMGQDSKCPQIFQIDQKIVNNLLGIQVLNIGPPYTSHPIKVLAFFLINQVQFYPFTIIQDLQHRQKTLEIKSLSIKYNLQRFEPKKLVMDNKGILYYVDDKGELKFIKYNHSIINNAVTTINRTSKQVTREMRQFWKNMTINVAKNIVYFTRTIIGYSKTFFTKNAQYTDIQYDSQRDLFFVYQCTQLSGKRYKQVIKVYNTIFQKPIYVMEESQFLDRNSAYDRVNSLKVIESRLNNDYNLVLLMDNGKRIYLDLTAQGNRKTVTYQAPPTKINQQTNQFTQTFQMLETSIIDESFLAVLFCGSSSFTCSFIRQEYSEKYEVVYKMEVELHGSPKDHQYFLHKKELDNIGPVKQGLLKNEAKSIKAKDMSLDVQAAFYRPQQLIHASDKMVQRITILRPVDILFSLVNELKNIPQIVCALQLSFGDFPKEDMIGFCCQILLDQQGVYYITQRTVLDAKIRLSIRVDPHQRNPSNVLDEVLARNMSTLTKARVEELVIDLAGQHLGKSKEQKEINVATGLLKYISKILKPIWFSNINDLSDDTCKSMLTLLQHFQKIFNKFKKRIRSQVDGMLTAGLIWMEHFRQLLILVKTITTLPDKSLHEAVTMRPQDFHPTIFAYLDKYCQPKQAQLLRKCIPFYVNDDFIKIFKLYLSIQDLKTKEEKLQLCKEQTHIPQYLIKHLSKRRDLEELKYMFDENHISAHEAKQCFQSFKSYRQFVKCLKEASQTLIQKQILLQKAQEKLRQQAKHNPQLMQMGLSELEQIEALINLQKLLKQFYNKNKQDSQNWGMRMSRRMTESRKSSKDSVDSINNLQHFLFDFQTLSELIEYSGDPLLDIAFANYYKPNERIDKIHTMVGNTIKQHKHINNVIPMLKYQLEYLIVKAKKGLSREVLIKIYLDEIGQLPEMIEIMNSEQGITDKKLFFLLSYVAKLTGDPEGLYEWTNKIVKNLYQDSPKFNYLHLCNLYLVLKYLPHKKEELQNKFTKLSPNETIFKKMLFLLQEDSPQCK